MQSYINNRASERFQHSFGSWSVLASMLEPIDFLRLQALNRLAYLTTISRVQTWLSEREPLILPYPFPDKNGLKSIYAR